MSKRITIKAVRANDLRAVLESLSPQEIAKLKGDEAIKNNKFVDKFIDELFKAVESYTQLVDKLNAALKPVVEKYQAKVKELPAELTNDERLVKSEALAAEGNKELSELTETKSKELELEKFSTQDVDVEVGSDDRLNFVKEIFPKLVDKYRSRKAFLETNEALEKAQDI